jgi:hypothetical protein
MVMMAKLKDIDARIFDILSRWILKLKMAMAVSFG